MNAEDQKLMLEFARAEFKEEPIAHCPVRLLDEGLAKQGSYDVKGLLILMPTRLVYQIWWSYETIPIPFDIICSVKVEKGWFRTILWVITRVGPPLFFASMRKKTLAEMGAYIDDKVTV